MKLSFSVSYSSNISIFLKHISPLFYLIGFVRKSFLCKISFLRNGCYEKWNSMNGTFDKCFNLGFSLCKLDILDFFCL